MYKEGQSVLCIQRSKYLLRKGIINVQVKWEKITDINEFRMIKCETSCCSDALERLVRAEYGFILDLFIFFSPQEAMRVF